MTWLAILFVIEVSALIASLLTFMLAKKFWTGKWSEKIAIFSKKKKTEKKPAQKRLANPSVEAAIQEPETAFQPPQLLAASPAPSPSPACTQTTLEEGRWNNIPVMKPHLPSRTELKQTQAEMELQAVPIELPIV